MPTAKTPEYYEKKRVEQADRRFNKKQKTKAALQVAKDNADNFEPIQRLSKDLKAAASLMGKRQARFLVDRYYQIQKRRIRDEAQIASSEGEPHRLLSWLYGTDKTLESDIQKELGLFARTYTVGLWLQSLCGVGPVISAGLLAHLDISQCQTAGHFWSFAGIAGPSHVYEGMQGTPNLWKKGEVRPWNNSLRTLVAFKLGECFVKVQSNEKDYYGKLFLKRKLLEMERNDLFLFRNQAEAKIAEGKISEDTEAYKYYSQGLLPPAHIHARARRWAVKIFLSHLHHVMYVDFFGKEPPAPYVFAKLPQEDHRHFHEIPNYPFDGIGKSLREMKE